MLIERSPLIAATFVVEDPGNARGIRDCGHVAPSRLRQKHDL
jgi:hypothetical protein